ncbi:MULTISPECIES: DUF4381 domain-containing protein [Stenotrophomonas]|uniref:DUF4381 family protein n=1 Tax=Stenotrophomonas rhizophila TaxID=216778 RepID=A0A498CGE9_9GAMM|nr:MULTISPECIES: DUF4381 domain-containing protein [Stenotrophomonas]KAB7630571.1 DUF4381 family protein [Stenotrophomonas rhizophila]RLK57109.1 uncharacterized protein DUF4381 [Stenotrophomonas rhizophila]
MSAAASLPLRDVQLPPSPPWWPPAPGWWLVFGAIVLVVAGIWVWYWRRRRARQRWLDLFDAQVAQAGSPVREVAAIAELLRRAARQYQPGAERLQGNAWLAFLDEKNSRAFSEGDGALLLDGGYRPSVDAEAVQRLRVLARRRYLSLLTERGR